MNLDTVQIDVPRSLLVAAFLEKMARAAPEPDVRTIADIPLTDMENRAALLPAIGAPLEGGIYAGITVRSNLPMALVLLPGDEKKPWKEARDWAAAQGGTLPTRMDALALWQNLPGEFRKEWYWTQEEVTGTGHADSAWFQSFDTGDQYGNRKSNGYRCRAVRRVSI